MEPRLTLVTLGVSDLERSTRFYCDGLKLPMRDGPEGVSFFETRGTWLSLYPRHALAEDIGIAPEGTGFAGFTLAHSGYFADPDGFMWEVAWNPHFWIE
jgi:catechol 2,3-dioxygenase-like lactoylglutathione lyase family enzyme